MSINVKIVMVGGGSYNWGPKLLSDFINTAELEGSEIILLDINLQAAEDMKAAAEKMASDAQRKFKFIATSDETAAFTNADFVIVTISTGGLDMMHWDLKIPEQYGIYQTVGDSVGPSGWSRLLRNVPVFVNMALKLEKLSPNAVFMNYTNPMAGLTGAVCEVSSLRTVGLCHGLFNTYNLLKRIFAVPEKDISVRFGGINHFFWLLDLKIQGENAYSKLKDKLKDYTLDDLIKASSYPTGYLEPNHLFCEEILKEYGYLNYAEDRHTCEFFTAYLTQQSMLERFKLARTDVETRRKTFNEGRSYTKKLASGEVNPPKRSRETAVDMVKAFVTNTPFIDVVDLPNVGQIDNLPRQAVVETLGLVNSMGFSPISIGTLPEPLRGLTAPHCQVQLMALDAALTGNRKQAMEALHLDPLCQHLSPSDVRKMGSELMNATKEYLPQFK